MNHEARSAKVAAAARAKREALIENVEWLIKQAACEAVILAQTGYSRTPAALKRHLARHGRQDLIPQVFAWDWQNSSNNPDNEAITLKARSR